MSTEQTVGGRLGQYSFEIRSLAEAREKAEELLGRDLTPDEFKALKPSTGKNSRKCRHFASRDCGVENLVFTINSTFMKEADEDEANEGKGRRDCSNAEAFYSFAIDSCNGDTGGLDEELEYLKHEKKARQLTDLRISRGQATKKDTLKYKK